MVEQSDSSFKSKVYPRLIYGLRVIANSVLCVQYGKWIHSGCAGVKRVTTKHARNFACWNCEGNIVEILKQVEKFCSELETVREFTYLGDRVSAGVGCEAAVTVRTKYICTCG